MPENIDYNSSPTNHDLLQRFSPFRFYDQRQPWDEQIPGTEPESAFRPLAASTPTPATAASAPGPVDTYNPVTATADYQRNNPAFQPGLPDTSGITSARQRLMEIYGQQPKREDYKPSIWRILGSAAAGGATAYAGGGRPQAVQEGMDIVQGGMAQPYNKAMSVYQPKLQAAQTGLQAAEQDYQLGRQRTMDESTLQERGELSRYRAAEAKRLEDALDTPAKRATYLQQNPEKFKELSDFERNDFLLTGKFPQREPQNTPEAAWNRSFGTYEKAVTAGDAQGATQAKKEMDALSPFVEQSKGFGKRDTSPTEWQAYLQKAGGDPTRAIAFKNADEIARARAGRGGLSEAERSKQAAQVEDTVADALRRSGNDPDQAIGLINGSKNIPPELKAKMRERVRERVRPGQPKRRGGLFDDEDGER